MPIYDTSNRAVVGFDIERHVKTHAVYNQRAPELLSCESNLSLLEKCVADQSVKQGDDIPQACKQIFSDVKNVCGLRRGLYTPLIKVRKIHDEPMEGYAEV